MRVRKVDSLPPQPEVAPTVPPTEAVQAGTLPLGTPLRPPDGFPATLDGLRVPRDATRVATPPVDPDLGDLAERHRLASELTRFGGSATEEDRALVMRELEKLPASILANLQRKGVRVVACRGAITDYLTNLHGGPRGWPPGSTWNAVPGLYNYQTHEVVIATREIDGQRAVPKRGQGHGAFNLVMHEVGHAYDYMNEISRGVEFRTAWQADHAVLTPYYVQAGNSGAEEAFAETLARYFGGDATLALAWPNLHRYLLNKEFP